MFLFVVDGVVVACIMGEIVCAMKDKPVVV